MPHYVRFLLLHAVIGMAVGLLLTLALIVFDVAGLGTLVMTSSEPAVAVLLLVAGLGSTFGSLAMGTGVMMLPRDEAGWRREFGGK